MRILWRVGKGKLETVSPMVADAILGYNMGEGMSERQETIKHQIAREADRRAKYYLDLAITTMNFWLRVRYMVFGIRPTFYELQRVQVRRVKKLSKRGEKERRN